MPSTISHRNIHACSAAGNPYPQVYGHLLPASRLARKRRGSAPGWLDLSAMRPQNRRAQACLGQAIGTEMRLASQVRCFHVSLPRQHISRVRTGRSEHKARVMTKRRKGHRRRIRVICPGAWPARRCRQHIGLRQALHRSVDKFRAGGDPQQGGCDSRVGVKNTGCSSSAGGQIRQLHAEQPVPANQKDCWQAIHCAAAGLGHGLCPITSLLANEQSRARG